MQAPIAPPYAEAISLLKNRDVEFHAADISVVVENESMSSISGFKKEVESWNREAKTTVDTAAVVQQDDNDEDEAPIEALHNLYISEKNEY